MKEKIYKTKNMSQKDLEEHYDVKLTNEEFKVIKDFAFEDGDRVVGDDYRFYLFDKYVVSIKQWGTKSGKIRKNAKYTSTDDFFDSFKGSRGASFGIENNDRFNFDDESLQEIYISIQEEIDNRYPKLEKKRETIREQNRQTLKEYKERPARNRGFNPDPGCLWFFILFFLAFILASIFGGGDPSPGGPRFFGHDGG